MTKKPYNPKQPLFERGCMAFFVFSTFKRLAPERPVLKNLNLTCPERKTTSYTSAKNCKHTMLATLKSLKSRISSFRSLTTKTNSSAASCARSSDNGWKSIFFGRRTKNREKGWWRSSCWKRKSPPKKRGVKKRSLQP